MKFLLAVIFSVSFAFAQPKVPTLNHWANDLTGTLSSSELSNLDFRLKTYQDSTSNQLIMLMIPTLGNYPLEYYSMDVAEKKKIGTKKNDNGLLFLIVKNDRKMRIEVGYGLEGVLPDALASSIIRNVVSPHFRSGDYYAGITDGINAMMSAIAGEYKADRQINDNGGKKTKGIGTILFIIFVIIMSLLKGRGRGGGGFIFFPGGFSSGSGGGSFGGGGFGGFSGGGGGFGGGGASGGW